VGSTLLVLSCSLGGGQDGRVGSQTDLNPTVPAIPIESASFLVEAESQLAAREYWASKTDLGLQAPNRRHDMRTYFEPTGVRVHGRTTSEASELLKLSLVGLGRGETLAAIGAGHEIVAHQSRVEIDRPDLGLVEWYENSEQGLEHGFILAAPPSATQLHSARPGALVFELRVTGAQATLFGESVVLTSEAGRKLDYGKLAVVDAMGERLAARFEVPRTDRIRLVVDDRGATYPIVVDPLLTGAADAQLESNQAFAGLGGSVAIAGDVNGDGYADVIVGASGYDLGQSDEGAAFVFMGSALGIGDGNPATAAAQLESNQPNALLGGSVSGAGDVNGDGYADVIVGASSYDAGHTDEGAAFVFLGSASGVLDGSPANAAARLESDQANALLGGSVAGAGDVNGDGYGDVIVGAAQYDAGQTDEGTAFLFLGSASGIAGGNPMTAATRFESDQPAARLGTSVSGAGDVNGDGYADVIVGANLYDAGNGADGAAFLFMGSGSGIANGNPATAPTQLDANQAGAELGGSVAGAGDVNGDGYADVIVGAHYYDAGQTNEGAAFVFLGSASGVADGIPLFAAAQLESNEESAEMGYSVAGAGDVNGDGYADVIVGTPFLGVLNPGAAFVYLGGALGIADGNPTTAAAQLDANQSNSWLGISVAGAGDVNGDGRSDVVVGASLYDAGEGLFEGAAFVYHGGELSATVFNFTFLGGTSAEAQQAFLAAGERWSAWLTDDVIIDMTVGTADLSPGTLASSFARRIAIPYSSFRSALSGDQTSPLDSVAVGSLSVGSSFGVLINRTSDNPNGSGSATPYLDAVGANNTTTYLTTANAKALGLAAGSGTVGVCSSTCDASITFANAFAFAFDYDPSDGISPGTYDLVGFATREIGHALGFVSGVDILDINSPPVNGPFAANQFAFVSPLDLFRFSDLSAASDVVDFTADTREKFFSIDGGATALSVFSTGRNFGDGQRAGQWKDGLGLGLMDPTGALGESLVIGPRDLQAFDVIGWNVVPEPEAGVLLSVGLLGLAGLASRRRCPSSSSFRGATRSPSWRDSLAHGLPWGSRTRRSRSCREKSK